MRAAELTVLDSSAEWCRMVSGRGAQKEFLMKEARISRRTALSLLGVAAAFGFSMPLNSEAQAQQSGATSDDKTTGTERRQERRTTRTERRQERRTERTERRVKRRRRRKERRKTRREGREERREIRREGREERREERKGQ